MNLSSCSLLLKCYKFHKISLSRTFDYFESNAKSKAKIFHAHFKYKDIHIIVMNSNENKCLHRAGSGQLDIIGTKRHTRHKPLSRSLYISFSLSCVARSRLR